MVQYITSLEVSLNIHQEKNLEAHMYKKLSVNLNTGAGGKEIFLWYKEGTESPITRVQLSFSDDMTEGLLREGYVKIDKNLNAGAGGNQIYLWYYKGNKESDIPITEVDVSYHDDAKKFQSDWERLACDLNRGAGGEHIFLWVKREKITYISDIIATDSFKNDKEFFNAGYTRMDESTNRGTNGAHVFLWYMLSTKKEGTFKDLKITNHPLEFENMDRNPEYEYIDMNLNKGNHGADVYLWYKKDDSSDPPIKGITLLYDESLMDKFEEAGVTVINKSLNSAAGGGHCACTCCSHCELYLGFYNAP